MTDLLISADLACPPNEVYAFRTFTFIANQYCEFRVFAEIENWDFRDTYWNWFKERYLLDYVADIITHVEKPEAYRIKINSLTCDNLNRVLSSIGFRGI